ncbi:FAD-binding oxidoreductase [Paracoccus sp. MBLB3053]|uniref:FAD-binding oxidoreductase n=1 Tax=Paracoccus aurantius TaxID=3073814 RepID=A0ABU2HW76_9RHOB|nr:FAD-binding oxidoreductase [Paracoccus sp. MBLB3053]MDS9469303.1 FAD-binding oxidoreductase [Paracoccus sp. MBLB3053]
MELEELRAKIGGKVTTAQDAAHQEAAAALQWNARKSTRVPAVIVSATSVSDVQVAVRFAAANGLRVSARGAGHNLSGIAIQDSIVIDLSRLDACQIDAGRRIAQLGPGVTNGRLAAALDAEGMAFPLGHCASVPMSGYLLGGGLGWNSGTWGFACSRVEAVDVVMPDGALRQATADHWPDIFWAARGGGPEFFGVIVGYKVNLEPLPRGMMSAVRVYPLDRMAELERWMAHVLHAYPRNVDVVIDLRNAPHPEDGRPVPVAAGICVVYAETQTEAARLHKDVAALAPQDAVQAIGPMPVSFGDLYAQTEHAMPSGKRFHIDSFWAGSDAGQFVRHIAASISQAPSLLCHSIVARYPEGRPAMPDAAFSMAAPVWGSLCAIWDDAKADPEHVSWVRDGADMIGDLALGHYVGEADLQRPGRLNHCYAPAALGKLRALQQLYDPKGLFLPVEARPEANGKSSEALRVRTMTPAE